MSAAVSALSLYNLLDPEVLADPYPLYRRLREEDPVHWDPFLSAWVVTRYDDVVHVLHHYSADRTLTAEQLAALELDELSPISQVMAKQMLFMDPPDHTRLRSLAAAAFTPARVAVLQNHIQQIVDQLIDAVEPRGRLEVLTDLAYPLPAIVIAEMLGVPPADRHLLKAWSDDFAEVLGNLQHDQERVPGVLRSIAQMTAYFEEKMRETRLHPRPGLIHSLLTAEIEGDQLTQEEVVGTCIVTMIGGHETITNLIGNGLLSLLRHPEQLQRLLRDPSLVPSAVEELLRYESPIQHTVRLAPGDVVLGDKRIGKGQSVIVVLAAANRDPERFPDPDRLDVCRTGSRHLAFGWAAHFCFGAALARIEGQIAFAALLRRLPHLRLGTEPVVWRENHGLRGLLALPVRFGAGED